MIVLGLILLIVGYLLPIPIFETMGIILLAVGVILVLLGATTGYVLGGRKYWY